METIKLDKERHLKVTLGGMKRFQEVTGKSLLRGFSLDKMGETEIVAFVWACLVWEDRTLSLEDVGFMVEFDQLDEIWDKLASLLRAYTDKKK